MSKKNASQPRVGCSWAVIIFLLYIFFPAGLALMISKLHKDREHYRYNGKGVTIVGRVFIIIGIIWIIMGLSGTITTTSGEPEPLEIFIIFALIIGGGGFALIRHGNKYKKIGENYERYKPLLARSRNGSIDDIASSIHSSYEAVYADLQQLIEVGALPDSYIDIAARAIVSPQVGSNAAMYREQAAPRQQAPTSKAVKCPNCGGINTVTTAGSCVCDYCGSPLDIK